MSTISPSLAPASSYVPNRSFLRDQHYAQHGKLMLLAIVFVFSLFLLLLVAVHCRKHMYKRQRDNSNSRLQGIVPSCCVQRSRVESN
ncbi:hypothetical protein BVRB_014450 [Beta vulgaris subsp. vulgaris]|uniref:Uncharacterized protein n=1 Tax=Beta vulgaris subsp. vulgaris TaxID=3555 RepID=A0A0J8B4U0_BETVV|nr:hypothetical protein BVRB_014450 [Beta vulgaris subsp. vulgaris]